MVPTVHVPAELRELTGGRRAVSARGRTLGEVIDALEGEFPGLRDRLVEDGRLRPDLALLLQDEVRGRGLETVVADADEIFILRPISGGGEDGGNR